MENQVKALIKDIGNYRFILYAGHHLDLFQTLYIPSVFHNLISLSKLDSVGYSFKFGNECFSLLKHNIIICSGILSDGLYKLKLDNIFVESLLTLHHNFGIKRGFVNESST